MPESSPFTASAEDAYSRARGVMALVRPAYSKGPEEFVDYIEATANLVREGAYDNLTSKQVDVVINEYARAIRTLNGFLNAREAVTKAIQGAVLSFAIVAAIVGVSYTVSPWLATLFIPWLVVVSVSLFVSHKCVEWRDNAAVSVPTLELLKELKKTTEKREQAARDKAKKLHRPDGTDMVSNRPGSRPKSAYNNIDPLTREQRHALEVSLGLISPEEGNQRATDDDRRRVVLDTPNDRPAGDNDAEGAQTPDPPKKEERKP